MIRIINQSVALIRPNNKIKPLFLKYLLESPSYQKLIYRDASGSTILHIYITRINKMLIAVPSLKEQDEIINIIHTIQEKIELLQQQNKTLETIVQTIFKEWFGKYQVEDELPEGWRVGILQEIIDGVIDNRGKTPPTIDLGLNCYPLIEVNSITGEDRNINLSVVRKFVVKSVYNEWFRKGHPSQGDVLISTVGSIGQLGQVFNETICIAQNIVALRSKLSGNFLYQLLKFHQQTIINLDISSVQPSIKVPHLLNLDIIIPSSDIILKFDKIVESLNNKSSHNQSQIQSLIKTRDELLPRLMSGQVRVEM